MPIALADGLNIKLNTAVQSVRYHSDKVEIDVYNPRANNREIKTLSGQCDLRVSSARLTDHSAPGTRRVCSARVRLISQSTHLLIS